MTTGECYHFLLRIVQSKPTSVPKLDVDMTLIVFHQWFPFCQAQTPNANPSYCSMATLFPCGGHSRYRCLGSGQRFFSLGNSEVGKIKVFVQKAECCHLLPSASFSCRNLQHFLCDQRRVGIAHGCMHQKVMPTALRSRSKLSDFWKQRL